MRVTIFFRKPRPGAQSIEELFDTILQVFGDTSNYQKVHMPYVKANLMGIAGNLRHCWEYRNGLCHITGDTHYVALATGRRSVLTIHDSYSVLQGSIFKKLLLKILWFWLPALIVKRITTISDKSKRELAQIIPFARHKIRVIPNPYNPKLLEGDVRMDEDHITNTAKPILLHLGTKSNKNLERTIVAMAGLPYKLYIIGKLSAEQADLLSQHKVDFRSYYNLPYSEVAILYHQCRAVCFASLYEGFGMPIIEAQLVGKPVITSDIDPMPWVAGKEGAHFVNPYDVQQIRAAIIKVMDDANYRNSLVERGLKNVQRFEPTKIASMYEEVYREVADS
jgi:glycosyltransferase involved in cell wall biosynthesis